MHNRLRTEALGFYTTITTKSSNNNYKNINDNDNYNSHNNWKVIERPVVQSPIKLILGQRRFHLLFITAKGGFTSQLWPNMIINLQISFP